MHIRSSLISAPHGFSARLGGVGTGIYESMNLGMNRGDDSRLVAENWKRFGEETGIDTSRVVFGNQVHKNRVVIAGEKDLLPTGEFPWESETVEEEEWVLHVDRATGKSFRTNRADGYVTNVPGVPLAVFTADCVPLLLEDAGNGVIGAVHCGWRSTVADIEKQAVDAMVSLGADPARIHAAVGPCICRNCFEVGPEVLLQVKALPGIGETPEDYYREKPGSDRILLDLGEVVLRRLVGLGIPRENLANVGECTMCNPDRYWSHRSGGAKRGSQASIICLPGLATKERT